MNKKLHCLFRGIKELEPSHKLEELILNKIELEKEMALKKGLALAYFGLIASTTGAVFTGLAFGQTILQSEFWNIATLVFSDAEVVLNNLNDFLFSLMETIPFLNIIAILLPVFALFLSMSWYSKLIQHNNYKHYKFI